MPFEEVKNDLAFAKVGFLGLNGSGKTFTATEIAIGLHKDLVARGIIPADQPVYMQDTETGRTWIKPKYDDAGIRFFASNEVSLDSLCKNMDTVAQEGGIMVIDSLTHFWEGLCRNYAARFNKTNLFMDDWRAIKGIWKENFTERFVNNKAHYIICGRQGYEYETTTNEQGKKTTERSSLKMKAESETGYEPSLLVVMERHEKLKASGKLNEVWREAYVLKDRSFTIDGQSFRNPTYQDFRRHFAKLNLGGEHAVPDLTANSNNLIKGGPEYSSNHNEGTACKILYEEIMGLLNKHISGSGAGDRADRADKLEKHFGTRSQTKVETMGYMELKHGYNRLHNDLEKKPAFEDLPLDGKTTKLVSAINEAF